jgi:hypothetical protein
MARNPFRSEAEAYRFLLLTVGYFALIVVAAAIATWLGVVVFVVLTVAVLWLWLRSRTDEPPAREVIPSRSAEDERRILVVANETVAGHELREVIGRKAEGVSEDVLLVCPALNSKLRTWTSDEDGARDAAKARLDSSLARLAELGVQARGEIGDGDPLQALEDALREFPADEIVVSTHPPGRSHWLELGVVENARMRYDVPVTHVVVDLGQTEAPV